LIQKEQKEIMMIDVVTGKQIYIEGNRINISVKQINIVRSMLDHNAIPHYLEDDAISIDGGPEMTNIVIHNSVDLILIQKFLDEQKKNGGAPLVYSSNKNKLSYVKVCGKQIGVGRREVINKGIDIVLANSENVDWEKHDLLIQVVTKD